MWMHRGHKTGLGFRALRGAIALLLAVAMGHALLHTHGPGHSHTHHEADAHDHNHDHDHGHHHDHDHAPVPEPVDGEKPCQTCILITGLDLPVLTLAPSAPALPVAVLAGRDESAPPSHLAWSKRLLRGPPFAA